MGDFLAGLMPKNPIDNAKLETMKTIAERVAKRFGENYLNSLKDVLIEQAEQKQAKLERKHEREAKRQAKLAQAGPGVDVEATVVEGCTPIPGPKPKRPRKKKPTEKKHKHKIAAKVVSWEKLDTEVDPYVVYIVRSNYKSREAEKSRRFKEFKLLHKKLGKKVPHNAKLPAAASKFGARNLHKDFLKDRKKSLTNYLEHLCDCETLTKDTELLKFLGIIKSEDPIGDEVFDLAIQRTKWDLWIWKKVVYDEPGQAIAKLVVEEIHREMWDDIVNACPPAESARKAALKVAYRAITTVVTPPVAASWNAAYDAAKPLKAKVQDVLGQMFDKVVQVKAEIKAKLKAGMTTALEPLVEVIKKVLNQILPATLPPIIAALQPIVEKLPSAHKTLTDAIHAGDIEKCKDIRDLVHDAKHAVKKKMEETVREAIKAVFGECSKDIAHDALKLLLSPFDKIIDIVNALVELIDPENYMCVVVHLMKEKDKLIQSDPTKHEDIDYRLDWEEWDTLWEAQMRGYDIRSAGLSLWWDLHEVMPDAGPLPDVFYDLSCDLQKMHYRVLKKFSWKFGDFLFGAMKAEHDTREWKQKVNESFIIGYNKALKCARKQLLIMVRNYSVEFIKRPVLAPINKHVVPLLKDVIDPLESSVPEPIRDVLNVGGLVADAIREAVTEVITVLVDVQADLAKKELDKIGVHL
eukprot:TRINITY_DN18441_c0_g1_i1.p1 TRINITY_DN18441_c0_g1~~TRINITY_DN18441_c0_g1_i1.p1  ORF type:complete len:692 (+),score=268.55 TRINITY_DN18441_c0_g1_i1:151-2226(+)